MTSIAIIGASPNRTKYGNKAVRAYLKKGYKVYPVNPNEKKIEGLTCYSTILDIPGKVDLASIYLPPEIGIKVLEQIKNKGVKIVYVNPGAESDELVKKGKELGLELRLACSILAIGLRPDEL